MEAAAIGNVASRIGSRWRHDTIDMAATVQIQARDHLRPITPIMAVIHAVSIDPDLAVGVDVDLDRRIVQGITDDRPQLGFNFTVQAIRAPDMYSSYQRINQNRNILRSYSGYTQLPEAGKHFHAKTSGVL